MTGHGMCGVFIPDRVLAPGNYPKENTLHIEHGESLKSRILGLYLRRNISNSTRLSVSC